MRFASLFKRQYTPCKVLFSRRFSGKILKNPSALRHLVCCIFGSVMYPEQLSRVASSITFACIRIFHKIYQDIVGLRPFVKIANRSIRSPFYGL